MQYLLDTHICTALIKKRSPKLIQKLTRLSPADVFISVISFFELYYALEKSKPDDQAKSAFGKFFKSLNIVHFDATSARESAQIRNELELKPLSHKSKMEYADILIAGIARSKSMTLVTSIPDKFDQVTGIKLQNWSDTTG